MRERMRRPSCASILAAEKTSTKRDDSNIGEAVTLMAMDRWLSAPLTGQQCFSVTEEIKFGHDMGECAA